MPFANVLDPIRTGFYRVKRRLNSITYKLELPLKIKLTHPINSAAHLEPFKVDEYGSKAPENAPVATGLDTIYPIDRT